MIVECDDSDHETEHNATDSYGGHCRFAILEGIAVLVVCLGFGRY